VDASEDFIPGGGGDQFNPKVGVIWNPFPNTTIRGAVFRTYKRILLTDQTLEPTQVAGFNQFFDEFVATDAWRWGVAIDQKLLSSLFAGAEFANRWFDYPFLIPRQDGSIELTERGGEEWTVSAYGFWTPLSRIALRAEYAYESLKNDISFDGTFPLKLHTHRVPIGISYFDPNGVSAIMSATYWNQDGRFERLSTLEEETGSNQFWTVDLSLNYRIPKRHGMVTLGVTNLFDEDFRYFAADFNNPSIQPDRMIYGRIAFAWP
jgi:outer membrane receptor protein involved in Fe transport